MKHKKAGKCTLRKKSDAITCIGTKAKGLVSRVIKVIYFSEKLQSGYILGVLTHTTAWD